MEPIDPYRILQVTSQAEQEVIQAAYRALALKYHPDRDKTTYAQLRMLKINAAYALLRDEEARANWDQARRSDQHAAVAASKAPPPRAESSGTRVSFGRYAGWTLRDLARQDPQYLRWLSRHSSGIAYRTEIYQILGRMGAPAA
jgi:DnaJ-class molecular chaperone